VCEDLSREDLSSCEDLSLSDHSERISSQEREATMTDHIMGTVYNKMSRNENSQETHY